MHVLNAALTAGFAAVLRTLICATSHMRAEPMTLLGLNLAIPFAVRPRLSLFRLSFSPALQPRQRDASRAFEAVRRY